MCKGLQAATYRKRKPKNTKREKRKEKKSFSDFFPLTSNQISFLSPRFTGEWIETPVFKVFLVVSFCLELLKGLENQDFGKINFRSKLRQTWLKYGQIVDTNPQAFCVNPLARVFSTSGIAAKSQCTGPGLFRVSS